MRRFPVFIFALVSLSVLSQNSIELPDADLSGPSRLTLYGVNYPTGMNGEESRNFYIDYKISEKLHIQLEAFYDKFGTMERTNSSFLLKWYIKKKLYLFAGPETEYDINQVTGELELIRVNLNVGVGYEVNPNFLLDLGYHAQINPSTQGA